MFPSILIQLENGLNELYFYFYFVLRHYFVAKKICKTKNKKNNGLTSDLVCDSEFQGRT